MNFKTIILSTSLSFLFGVYSIYSLIEYLEKIKEAEKDEIDSLKKSIIDINNNYFIEFQKIKSDMNNLSNKIIHLETNKIEPINCVSTSIYDTSLKDIMEDKPNKNIDSININTEAVTIDIKELNQLEKNVPLIANNDNMCNINNEIENDYGFEILEKYYSNNENIIKSKNRNTSISEINWWAEATNKFIFG